MHSQRTRLRPATRIGVVASSLAAAAILLLPNAAFAVDTTIGSAVGNTQCQTDFDVVQMSSTVSYAVPAGGGNITSWTTQAPDLAFVGPVNLAVWTLKSPGTYTLVGLSASETITKIGANTFAANIPVLGGELIGLHVGLNGLGQTYCLLPTAVATPPTNIVGFGTDATPTVGTDHAMTSLPDFQLNVAATVSTSPPPPPPPPSDGCDQTGDSAANAQCKDDHKSKDDHKTKEGDKTPATPEAKP